MSGSPNSSNFPGGFNGGVTIRGIPVLQSYSGKVFYVNNSTALPEGGVGGSDGNPGTYQRPFATLDYAIGRCTAGRGDIIFLMPGHAETVSTASGITADIAGINIIGLGTGASRPTFTFSATASTIVISANNVTVENIITKPSIDSVVSPIVVSGTDCHLDFEHQDASSTVEAVRAVLTTATADRLYCKLKYIGFTAGNAVVNAVRLIGVDTATVDVDFYGVASTAVVEMVTTQCTNVEVTGWFHNSGTALTKNVVDTGGISSLWSARGWDNIGGYTFSGGSAAALASDDVAAVSTALLVPTADATSNTDVADVVGNKTDAGVQTAGTTKSVLAYAKGAVDMIGGVGITTFPTAAAAANGISIAEVLRYVSENQMGRLVTKTYADLTGFDTAASFTVTGDVMVRAIGVVGATAITSTSGTTTLALGTTEITTAILAASTIDNTQFAATDVWVDSSPANDAERMTEDWVIIGGGADIILTRSVDDITAGSLTLYCWYKPLSSDGAVVAV